VLCARSTSLWQDPPTSTLLELSSGPAQVAPQVPSAEDPPVISSRPMPPLVPAIARRSGESSLSERGSSAGDACGDSDDIDAMEQDIDIDAGGDSEDDSSKRPSVLSPVLKLVTT